MDHPALDIFLAPIGNYSCVLYTSTTHHLYSVTFKLIDIETFSSRQTLLCSLFGIHAHKTRNGLVCRWVVINYHVSYSNPLVIRIQITCEGGLAQFAFSANLFNERSFWTGLIQIIAHLMRIIFAMWTDL